jgi:hypothetical protein
METPEKISLSLSLSPILTGIRKVISRYLSRILPLHQYYTTVDMEVSPCFKPLQTTTFRTVAIPSGLPEPPWRQNLWLIWTWAQLHGSSWCREKTSFINHPWLGMVSLYHLYIYGCGWGMVYDDIVFPTLAGLLGQLHINTKKNPQVTWLKSTRLGIHTAARWISQIDWSCRCAACAPGASRPWPRDFRASSWKLLDSGSFNLHP